MNIVKMWRNLEADPPSASFEVDIPPEMRQGALAEGLANRVARSTALQVPAVLRSRNLIATPAALPLQLRNSEREIVEGSEAPTTLFDQIDPDLPNNVVLASTYEDLLFEGECLWRIIAKNARGFPTYCEHISFSRWAVHPSFSFPNYHGDFTPGNIYIDGEDVSDDWVIRFYSPNPPLLVHAARAIRTCLDLDKAAGRYADDGLPLGVLTPKDGARINEDDKAIQGLLDKWRTAVRTKSWAYLSAALEAKTLQFNAEQIQLAEQRQHAVLEIARAAGVDPEDLGVSTTSRTYQNAEQRRQDLLDFTLRPYMEAIEQRLSMGDVTPRGWYVKTNLDAFLRSDTKGRMEAYAIGEPLGLYPPDRLAELEDIPRVVKPKQPAPVLPNLRSVGDNADANGEGAADAVGR